MNKYLKEGEDFYINNDGNMVLTEKYLKNRGHCCQSGCTHCPYDYSSKVDPNIPAELQGPNSDSDNEDTW